MKIKLAIIYLMSVAGLQAQAIKENRAFIEAVSTDTLTVKLDSVHTSFQQKSDSIQQELQDGLTKIERSKTSVQGKIDSLSNLNLSTEKYKASLDSLNGKANELVSSVNNKLEKLKTSTLGKVNELQLPPELKSQVDKMTGAISAFELPGLEGINSSTLNKGLANLNVGNIGNLNIEGISNVTDDLNLRDASLPDTGNMTGLGTDQLSNIEGLENVTGISEQVGGYSEDIKTSRTEILKMLNKFHKRLKKK